MSDTPTVPSVHGGVINTSGPITYSALSVQAPDPVAIVDDGGRLFVYTDGGEKLDTGIVMKMPLPVGQEALIEVIRVLAQGVVKAAALQADAESSDYEKGYREAMRRAGKSTLQAAAALSRRVAGEPVAWRYRLRSRRPDRISLWRYVEHADDCNQSEHYEREPLFLRLDAELRKL